MKPLVLGLNSFHPDSSAALVGPDGLIAAIAEERINRRKHCAVFPSQAVAEVLRIAGARVEDVTDIAIARDRRANTAAKLALLARSPRTGISLAGQRLRGSGQPDAPAPSLAAQLGVPDSALKARVHAVEHHLAHVASSFLFSPFTEATGLSIDGAGDFATLMIAQCKGNDIRVLRRCHPPHSLGMFYTTISVFLGFNRYGEEYKVMGLAALGQDRFAQQLRPMISWSDDRGLRLDESFFRSFSRPADTSPRAPGQAAPDGGEFTYERLWTDAFERQFGPPRVRNGLVTDRDRDLACSLQARFEEVYLAAIRAAVAAGGSRNLALAGGCALNGVANAKALRAGLFDRVFIHPAAGDDGTAAGAAAYVLHSVLGVARPSAPLASAALGPEWSEAQLAAETAGSGFSFRRLAEGELVDAAADALAAGKIVGWFQGREEWGPRALGNRSILAHPGWPNMKDLLNSRIKNREPFRPFAPAVLADRLGELFEGDHPAPFMGLIYPVRAAWRQKLSAVTHDDGTARVQTVDAGAAPLYHRLIAAFDRRTGIPALLNTSFNENEPIVHTPKQALDTFARTRMDCLAIGPFWCEKSADAASKAQAISSGY